MRRQLGIAPSDALDTATKGYVTDSVVQLNNKALGPGSSIAQNLVANVTATNYDIPINGVPYQGLILGANITAPTLASGTTNGQLLIISVIQDGTGGRSFNWANLANVWWSQLGRPPTTTLTAYGRTTAMLVWDSAAWVEIGRQQGVAFIPTQSFTARGQLLAGLTGGGYTVQNAGSDRQVLTADATQYAGFGWTNIPHDLSYLQTVGTRATGVGDNALGVKLQRQVTFVTVTYRCGTADANGSSTFELRKNGTAVSGTSVTLSAGNQTPGQSVSGSWTFVAGDVLTVGCTAVGTTPGTGLVADLEGYVT